MQDTSRTTTRALSPGFDMVLYLEESENASTDHAKFTGGSIAQDKFAATITLISTIHNNVTISSKLPIATSNLVRKSIGHISASPICMSSIDYLQDSLSEDDGTYYV